MTSLGQVFKQVRQSRRLTLKDAAGTEYSTSMLSRFENGQADITSQKLLDCLDNIYLSAEELYHLANDLEPSYFDHLRIKGRELSSPLNKEGLAELIAQEEEKYQKQLGKFHQLNAIWLKSIIKQHSPSYTLSDEEIDVISDYFFSVDYWGNYERELIADLMMVLPLPLYHRYCLEMIKHTEFSNGVSLWENRLHTSLLHGLFQATEQNNLDLGQKFICLIDKHFSQTRDAYMRIITMICKGTFYKYRIDRDKGQELLLEGVDLLERLGYQDVADYYRIGLATDDIDKMMD